jgi:tRNA A37 methylthiotransferase MiaB
MKTFLFVNQSCNRRQEEIGRVRRFFLLNGFAEEEDPARADLVVFFTCAFCKSKVAEMLEEIARLRSLLKGGGELIVGSCLPKTDGPGLRAVFDGRTITPTDFSALDGIPGITVGIEEMPPPAGTDAAGLPVQPLTSPHPGKRRVKKWAGAAARLSMRACPALRLERLAARLDTDPRMAVFVASGCRRKCSYCAIRFATGPLKSKPPETVKRMMEDGWDQGYRKFDLYADSLGDYGLDIGTDLGRLFEWLRRSDRAFSVGLYDLHPQAFLKYHNDIRALGRAGRIHFLYVPLQSGSGRVLGAMNRPCDVLSLRDKLAEIRRRGGVFLQTSVIVGFPGETDREFEDTVAFLKAVRFSDVLVHFYTDMPDTESSRRPDKIGKADMRRRLDRLEKSGIRFDRTKARREWETTPPPP